MPDSPIVDLVKMLAIFSFSFPSSNTVISRCEGLTAKLISRTLALLDWLRVEISELTKTLVEINGPHSH